jgi:hypothetical protein
VGRLEVHLDGPDGFAFGDAMTMVVPALIELLGAPIEDVRMHGDLPLGFGGADSTARTVDFGGLELVFGDWPTPYRDDGVMHLVAWGISARRTASGTRLLTRVGVDVGSSVAGLRDAFDSELELPPPWCHGPVWYFAVGPDDGAQLIGGLMVDRDASVRRPWSSVSDDVRVDWLSSGQHPEDWGGPGFTC